MIAIILGIVAVAADTRFCLQFIFTTGFLFIRKRHKCQLAIVLTHNWHPWLIWSNWKPKPHTHSLLAAIQLDLQMRDLIGHGNSEREREKRNGKKKSRGHKTAAKLKRPQGVN